MNVRIIRFLFGTTIALVIALLLLILPMPVASAPTVIFTISVDTESDEFDNPANTTCSLREAIKAANDSADFGGCTRMIAGGGSGADTILMPSGTYTLTLGGSGEDADVTGDLDITNTVIISATGATSPVVVGGASWDDRIFHILTGTVTMKGMIIRGGLVHTFGFSIGGGIYNLGTLTLNSVTLSSNSVQIDTCSGSPSAYGGGIYNSGTATLTNVTLSQNGAGANCVETIPHSGGAGIANGGNLTLNGVTLSNNSTSGNGGGIINGNRATLTNVTFSANYADKGGGGIYTSGAVTLTNVTLNINFAGISGDSIFKNSGAATLTNTILSQGGSSGACNTPLGGASNLSGDGTCGFGGGRDNINPMPAPLGNYGGSTQTHMLLPSSPAINFGTNTGCPSTDQRGASRPIGNVCDVGAVEAGYLFLPLILK